MAHVSSAGRALRILQALVTADHPPTQAELVRELGIPKSTFSTLITELREMDFVTVADRRHLPGPAMVILGYQATHAAGIGRGAAVSAHPLLERLAAATRETAVYSIEVGRTRDAPGSVLALDFVVSPNAISYVPGIGRLQPIHRAAAGRVFLAFTNRSARDLPPKQFVRTTSRTLVTADEIDAVLALARERGYATNVEETIEGITAIAAPILDAEGQPIAAITVLGLSQRIGDPSQTIWPILRRELEALDTAEFEHGRAG